MATCSTPSIGGSRDEIQIFRLVLKTLPTVVTLKLQLSDLSQLYTLHHHRAITVSISLTDYVHCNRANLSRPPTPVQCWTCSLKHPTTQNPGIQFPSLTNPSTILTSTKRQCGKSSSPPRNLATSPAPTPLAPSTLPFFPPTTASLTRR